MGEEKRCNVAGFPIKHSLTPYLFALVHEHLNLEWQMPGKIATSSVDDIFKTSESTNVSKEFKEAVKKVTKEIIGEPFNFQNISKIEVYQEKRNFDGFIHWGSITSPLKHQLGSTPANCYTFDKRGLRHSMTDGYAVVLVAEHFGLNFDSNPVLCLKGGGSAAIATAEAWFSMGGNIKAENGKRKLPEKLLRKCDSESDPDLYLDFDNSSNSDSLSLIPKYDSELQDSENRIDGRWMLVSQHLLAWAILFSPENAERLPSLDLLFKRLISLESMNIHIP
ncbi:MAG TPA: hypothetical protein QF644_03075 [Candidatus Poseidoniaceae archaeon]|nr:hypothetical protein [Candidatus Poseidoniaceae archaeon]